MMTTNQITPEAPGPTDGRRTRVQSVHTVGVPVSDQDRSLEFYLGTLGMEKKLDAPLDELGGRWIEVAPSAGGTTLALIRAGDKLTVGVETGIRLTTDDAAALHQQLQSDGVAVDELLNWPGVPPMFAFRDPDGNGLEIVQVS